MESLGISMQMPTLVLLGNLVATCYMVGLIWVVQLVHYPLFAKVGSEKFSSYQTSHQTLISFVVGPPMLVEMVTAVLLLWYRPAAVSSGIVYVALALLAVIWLSTALVQVPCHEKLTHGFDAAVHARLVNSNWIRTVAWSVRGALAVWMLVSVLDK